MKDTETLIQKSQQITWIDCGSRGEGWQSGYKLSSHLRNLIQDQRTENVPEGSEREGRVDILLEVSM